MTIKVDKRAIGCNAKVSIESLLRLSSAADIAELEADCGVISIGQAAIAHTIDTVFPFSEDALLFVQGAVLHCANDLICKGVTPISAAFSLGIGAGLEQQEAETISASLSGFLTEIGVNIDNCHSFNASDTSITISMLGSQAVLPSPVEGAEYCLALTKPLGAVHAMTAPGIAGYRAREIMKSSCLRAVDCIRDFSVSPTTDVSGYGLLGHLAIAAKKYSLEVDVQYGRVPLLACQEEAEISCSSVSNSSGFSEFIDQESFSGAPMYSLFAGETNGPILAFVEAGRFMEFSERMRSVGIEIYQIGNARFSASGYSVRGRNDG